MERRLTWDPRELHWKVWVQDQIKHVPFFPYRMKILGSRSWKEPTANVF